MAKTTGDGAANQRARLFEAERVANADSQRQVRLVELSFEPVVVWSEQDGIIEWNLGAEQLYGYTRAEAIGKTSHDLLRTVFSDSLAAMLAALERDGRWAGELRHTTKDGREVVVESRHQAITVDGRRVILETNRDVTERQSSEERLRASEARFRTLAENISQLAWMAHPDGYIYWYNPRWYAYTGTTPESQVGWGWQSVHDPNELPRVMERWTTSIASGQAFDMVFPLRGADGVFRPFLTRIMPVKDEHGQVTGWFGTNTDISDQVRLQEELRTANAAKDEFLSIASHELRTPITSSKANLQLIARRIARVLEALGDSTEPDAAAAHAQLEPLMPLLGRGEVSLNRLNRLVGDLLDSSRIQAGKLAIRPACVDLRALVREAMDEALQPWPLRVVRAAGALQAERTERQATTIWVNADPDRLRQVVINLLTNAFKYAPPDRPITVGLEARGAMARVWVRDQGPGLSPEQQAHLFERFYRVEGIGHQEGSNIGLGLGLYICREIVTLHGGQIGIESAPGKGSTFWFSVPLSDRH